MENSSALATSQDSPITFPASGFWWLWTILFLCAIVGVFGLVVIIGMVYWAISHHLDVYTLQHAMLGMPGITIQSIAEVAVVAVVFLLLPPIAKTSLAGIGFRKISAAQWVAIATAAALMFIIVTPLASLLQTVLHFKQAEAAVAVYAHASGWQKAAFAFFGIAVAPAFEEAVFRWVLFNAVRHWWGFWPGAVISSLLFGLAHAQPPLTPAMFACITFPLAVGGLVLCWVYTKTNNAWASYITHGAFNALSLIVLTLFPQLAK